MSISKYQIYEYWSDKSITKDFQVKQSCCCTPSDEAVAVTALPDEIFCWACMMPQYRGGQHRKLSAMWNNDGLLQKAHIVAASLGGTDLPENHFLLCPQCHAESPDTINPRNFYAWVYYKRTHENFAAVLMRDIEKAAKILGLDMQDVEKRMEKIRTAAENEYLRKEMLRRCAMHGSFFAPLTRSMAIVDWLMDENAQRAFSQWKAQQG